MRLSTTEPTPSFRTVIWWKAWPRRLLLWPAPSGWAS